ncbi:MAG: hypothetical protein ACJA1L_002318 [Paracoccaceae bacterium]|jgi:hypothetical protein
MVAQLRSGRPGQARRSAAITGASAFIAVSINPRYRWSRVARSKSGAIAPLSGIVLQIATAPARGTRAGDDDLRFTSDPSPGQRCVRNLDEALAGAVVMTPSPRNRRPSVIRSCYGRPVAGARSACREPPSARGSPRPAYARLACGHAAFPRHGCAAPACSSPARLPHTAARAAADSKSAAVSASALSDGSAGPRRRACRPCDGCATGPRQSPRMPAARSSPRPA